MSTADGEFVEDVLIAGRYRVRERLGAGGMGVVHRATDTRLNREVAIKRVLLRGLDNDDAAGVRRRTLREAEIAARVHHPRIVAIFDVLDDATGPLLVLEYLPSRGLNAVVADVGVLTPGVGARVGAQIAEALAAAHAAGIVHRDVKPGNVLVGRRTDARSGCAPLDDPLGPVKLADFGISHLPDIGTLTSSGIGTPAYFAPETARGEPPTAAADVYALGATLHTVTTGTPPFGWGTGNPLELIRRIAHDPVPEPTIGGPLGELLEQLTAVEPGRRPSAARAAEALWRLADRPEPLHPVSEHSPGRVLADTDTADASLGAGIGLPRTPRVAEPTQDPTGLRRRPWYRSRTALAGAGILLLAAVGAVVLATGGVGRSGGPAFPTAVPARTIGDPRTADPCSLVRPDALGGFGATRLVPDYGGFASCTVEVAQRGSDTIDVSTEFRAASSTPPEGERQRLGDALVIRRPADGTDCRRYLVLADGTPVDITASFNGKQPALAEVCAVAETAVAAAASTAAEDGIGRRDPPDTGLWTRDACSLLGPADLPFLPPASRSDPSRGFAGWQCDWSDGDDSQVSVLFDRYDPPSETGRAVPGTPAFVRSDEPGRCNAEVPRRPFLSAGGRPRSELLRVRVQGPQPVPALCDRAAALATVANPS